MFTVLEAVARFFPVGADYDRKQAERFIRWLDSCGFAVVPKTLVSVDSTVKPIGRRASRAAAKNAGTPHLRLVK